MARRVERGIIDGVPKAVLVCFLVVAVGTVVTTADKSGASPLSTKVLHADLDGDGVDEQVQVVVNRRLSPYGGNGFVSESYVRILERRGGGRVRIQQVSPKAENATVRLVHDYAQDQRPDVWYAESLGNAGSLYMGLVSWNGLTASVLWAYRAGSSGLGRKWSGARASLVDDPTANGRGFEIRLQEGVLSAGEPTCCPSHERISLYRFNGHKYVLYRRVTNKL